MGPLAGNHFLTIVDGRENLAALGNLVLWEGAQEILFEAAQGTGYRAGRDRLGASSHHIDNVCLIVLMSHTR